MDTRRQHALTALMFAAENRHEQVALVLLKAGAAVNAQNDTGVTALMLAVKNSHEQVALDMKINETRGHAGMVAHVA